MQVSEVMTPSPEFVTPQTPISEAARRLRFRDIGSLPVCDSTESPRLLGMITDRDIAIRAVADERDPGTPVGEIMSTDVQACRADHDLEVCAGLMRERQLRRIPVVDAQDQLVGIVALADLAIHPETSPVAAQSLPEISKDRMKPIRETAFQLWEQDGAPAGHDLEYWTRAEALAAQQGQRMAA